MEAFRNYVSGIIVVSVLAILLENLIPDTQHKKYINVTIGLIVMLAIVSPLTGLSAHSSKLTLPETVIDDADLSSSVRLIAEEFERRLSQTLSEEAEARCGRAVDISVEAETNENGEIVGIRRITAYPLDDALRKALSDWVGIDSEKVEEVRP